VSVECAPRGRSGGVWASLLRYVSVPPCRSNRPNSHDGMPFVVASWIFVPFVFQSDADELCWTASSNPTPSRPAQSLRAIAVHFRARRSVSMSPPMSAGIGASKHSGSPVAGWAKASRMACRA